MAALIRLLLADLNTINTKLCSFSCVRMGVLLAERELNPSWWLLKPSPANGGQRPSAKNQPSAVRQYIHPKTNNLCVVLWLRHVMDQVLLHTATRPSLSNRTPMPTTSPPTIYSIPSPSDFLGFLHGKIAA